MLSIMTPRSVPGDLKHNVFDLLTAALINLHSVRATYERFRRCSRQVINFFRSSKTTADLGKN
jgi:hypothetical protein